VIVIDADLQDPPELIRDFVANGSSPARTSFMGSDGPGRVNQR